MRRSVWEPPAPLRSQTEHLLTTQDLIPPYQLGIWPLKCILLVKEPQETDHSRCSMVVRLEGYMQFGSPPVRLKTKNLGKEVELVAISLDQFGGIYSAYRPRIYCLCVHMTGNCAEAEDLTQEAFLRLFHKLNTFRGESSFYRWLRRLAINVALLRFQKPSWRRGTSLDGMDAPNPRGESSPGIKFGCVDCNLEAVVERVDVQRALDRLPRGFKTVLILHDVEGFGHREISQLMGCTIGTSQSQLDKVRSRMRGFLGAYRRSELVA